MYYFEATQFRSARGLLKSFAMADVFCDILLTFLHVIGVLRLHYPGRVAQSVGHPTRKSGVLGSIPGLATYFCFSFRFFKKGSCQLLAKVCARSTGLPLRRSKPAQEKCG